MKTLKKLLNAAVRAAMVIYNYGKKYLALSALILPFLRSNAIAGVFKKAKERLVPLSKFKLHMN